ncbi:DNA-binding protein RFXANK-like isoform X1 [Osmia bicornis bicornis]|uniref:DNA-binding protein RFXANK-like isoform X1 n=1 Tax=Osmia bicornis bicornis TaxID=1437191 RepID=UPI0010F91A30|nr:DNA-binding protein RFXANK-like isoform X1 [Osmia bicornis bicornis]XP_029053537.1 DNA-binding protein RFXANK-like isoform X1 [Osmia bicornis bicornis]XP_029053538.1 DNA-binding protein RFXANK-like isoform X1 [Osmia bicornis bicornis]XP_029053539.1 DNA-binding protein RFXANK-like isoform X1 [Osmia bicornis bicornis]
MENQIHSELIVKEEEEEREQKCNTPNTEPKNTIVRNGVESTIGIRPRPLICKPENVNIGCKSEPLETKWHWAPGAWQDATRTSAFQPYKPPTLLTNLQRGNTQTEIPQLYGDSDITFHTLAGQGELTPEHINSSSVDAPDEKGLTGLMWAAGYGQLGSAEKLLKAGANKNYRGLNGETPLHLAAAYGHHDLVKLLLNHGADSNASDEEGNTPLIYGAYGNHPHVCYELLSREADITCRNIHNISAYHAAVLNNSLTAKAVIENYLIQQVVNVPSDILQ